MASALNMWCGIIQGQGAYPLDSRKGWTHLTNVSQDQAMRILGLPEDLQLMNKDYVIANVDLLQNTVMAIYNHDGQYSQIQLTGREADPVIESVVLGVYRENYTEAQDGIFVLTEKP